MDKTAGAKIAHDRDKVTRGRIQLAVGVRSGSKPRRVSAGLWPGQWQLTEAEEHLADWEALGRDDLNQ